MRSLLIDQLQKARRESGRTSANPLLYWGLVQRLCQLVWSWLRARWLLRSARTLGRIVVARGPLSVQQQADGQLDIGTGVRIWSDIEPTHLVVGPGAQLRIGDDCFFNGGLIASYNSITIGKGVYIAPMSQVTDSHAFGWPTAADPTQTAPIVLEDHVWIATRAIVMPGVHIGEGAVVAVGAIVTEDVPAYTVVGGNPARVLRTLNKRTL